MDNIYFSAEYVGELSPQEYMEIEEHLTAFKCADNMYYLLKKGKEKNNIHFLGNNIIAFNIGYKVNLIKYMNYELLYNEDGWIKLLHR